jgi:hypothetical protein
MSATTRRKKTDPVPPEPIPAEPAADTAIQSPTRGVLGVLPNINEPRKQLLLLDYIRHRAAGFPLPFDVWAPASLRLDEVDRGITPSQMLANYTETFAVPPEHHTDILIGYADLVMDAPDLTFGAYLAQLFGEDLYHPPATMAEPRAPAAVNGPVAAVAEPAPAPEPARSKHPGDRPGPKPGTRTEGSSRTRRPPGATKKEAGTADLTNSRVVYKTTNGKVVYGVCVRDDGGTVDIIDDIKDDWRGIRRDLVKPETGPVVWTISQEQYAEIREMLAKDRGLWPGADEHAILFELVRRVAPSLLVVVTVHNDETEPFVDAYVYDEAAADGENDVPFEHRPVADIAGDYLFSVPGIGDIPARVVVK